MTAAPVNLKEMRKNIFIAFFNLSSFS